jgi:TolA-binding protein
MSRDAADSNVEGTAKRVADFVAREIGSQPPLTPDAHAVGLRLPFSARVRRRRSWVSATAATVLALLFAGLVGLQAREEQPLAQLNYRVNEGAPPVGGYVRASDSVESLLSFSDGSELRMAARARGRVVEVNGRGARFALEEGTMSVDVRPRLDSHWLFEAGPFVVTVRGTSFNLAWNPNETVLEVRLQDGAVTVANNVWGNEIQMRAGQTLRVSLRDATTTLGTLGGVADSSPSTTLAPSATAAPSETAPPAPIAEATAAVPRWSNRGWPKQLAAGKAAAIVSDAERAGVAEVLERADGEDLWALANAARYTARYGLAKQALLAQRTRFPSSQRAREAAFLIGRLHDGDPAEPGQALAWYERYLTEVRDGAHVSDALGRKMTLLQRWGRSKEAVSIAREYVRRFPGGTYANAARVLIRAETPPP